MLHTLAVSGYRSLRDVVVPLGPLTVVTGANGVGKSSLYRCVKLLASAAQGTLVRDIAREGGFTSACWAGPETISRSMRRGDVPIQGTRRDGPVAMRFGFTSDDFGYSLELGKPSPGVDAFGGDPEIKREVIWAGQTLSRGSILSDRDRRAVKVADDEGRWNPLTNAMPVFESLLTRVADPRSAPEVLVLRDRLRAWRFYDHLRADAEAPARQPQVGTWTPVLAHDGSDVASALATLARVGDGAEAFDALVEDAFPGCTVDAMDVGGRFVLAMRQPGLLRPLLAPELSEGTLRYLMLLVALNTPSPPELLVLNEPEASLHVDLLPSLARLIALAAVRSQVWVVTHSAVLSDALTEEGATCHVLEKDTGETRIRGQGLLQKPDWSWPARSRGG